MIPFGDLISAARFTKMASRCRCFVTSSVLHRFSALSVASSEGPFLSRFTSNKWSRYFSDKNGDGGGSDDKGPPSDPFGVNYEDGSLPGKIGPTSEIPPKYKRDPTTGRFTGDVELEASEDDLRVLKLTRAEREQLLKDRFVKHWNESGKDPLGDPKHMSDSAKRIREEYMALNTFGRSVEGLEKQQQSKDSEEEGFQDETGLSVPLTKSEFRSFQAYLKKEHKASVDEDELLVDSARGDREMDDLDWDLKWLTAGAQRDMQDPPAMDPILDMMPSEMSPKSKVNRKNAKPIPKTLLSHLNITFLRRYITPAGQIMNRSITRLGAKDQRKIAKLIKRARHLGLIPHYGRWKVEDHGYIYENDIHEDKDWELELIRRGLVKRGAWKKEEEQTKLD